MKLIENEEKIVSLATNGDEKAFEQLFEAYQHPIYNFIYRTLGNETDAADATQEVFFKVYKKISTLRNLEFFSTWLFSIAKNEAITLARRKKNKTHQSIEDSENNQLDRQLTDDNNLLPDDRLFHNEFEHIFQKILLELPDIYRMAFILGVLEEKSYEEVAKIMDCTVGNVKSRVFRARAQIANKLDKIYALQT